MINPNDVYERYRTAGVKWAELDGIASNYEEMRKPKRAQIMISFGDMSVNKAEMQAEASKEYIDHITRMVSARTEANIARAEWEAIKSWIETVRTLEASRRAEMQLK